MVKVLELANKEVLHKVSELYKQVWKSEEHSIKERILKHSLYEGFQGFVILSNEDKLIGFSYGYTSLPGQYYHELLAKEFYSEQYNKWLKDCFEFVELAVNPSFRKQGFGNMLITKLLEEVDNKTAILTTQIDNKPARSLYESLQWKVLKEPFYQNNSKQPYVIMGKELM
ncbi:GNAT family N-acetyltransferase [Oceanobacillus sp. 143]|uniref:N-acetyltransferase n=1 Tax=Oceanobacillus zhaokaii TaxID=2052660 RepID=A0A345PFP4_9BACI|nr:GNAT family N-acetyltransferase [Oceanobacillus zhaokaii]AXI08824.1 N-acetyltransferase [Oceanobacillus zhaokaii]QGS68516.1 GNAT family N-acetyltransferase [Oceanobacillus sp. 143]